MYLCVWEGFGGERVKIVIQEITKVFIDLDIPENAIEIIIHETPSTIGELVETLLQKNFKNKKTRIIGNPTIQINTAFFLTIFNSLLWYPTEKYYNS